MKAIYNISHEYRSNNMSEDALRERVKKILLAAPTNMITEAKNVAWIEDYTGRTKDVKMSEHGFPDDYHLKQHEVVTLDTVEDIVDQVVGRGAFRGGHKTTKRKRTMKRKSTKRKSTKRRRVSKRRITKRRKNKKTRRRRR